MNDDRSAGAPRSHSSLDESGTDVRGYVDAIGRSKKLIAAIVIVATATVVALSLTLPKSYKSVARIALDSEAGVVGSLDAESTRRQLATLESLVTSTEVLDPAAEEIPGETADSLDESIESSVDDEANIINVAATDGDPERAAEIAQTVATEFLTVQASQNRDRLRRGAENLRTQIDLLETQGGPGASEQIAILQERLSQILVQLQLEGSELTIAQPAEVPTAANTPRPVRNSILALFGSLFVGVLIALARDQLRPALRGPRQVSRLSGGLPVLAAIPYTQKGFLGRRKSASLAAEHEAYQTLRASLRQAVPPERHAIILVTSSLHGEGKTTVTGRLGRGLAQAGYRTLLISGDLRAPKLQQSFELPLSPGLAETLELVKRAGVSKKLLEANAHPVAPAELASAEGREPSERKLDVLTSGEEPNDPSGLLASEAAGKFFEHLRQFRYDYVLIDCPPLLGLADVQALLPHADEMLLVGCMDRLTIPTVIETNELLTWLDARPVGLVLLGATNKSSPYYYYLRRSRGGERSGSDLA